jgi:hypothetical protein
MAALIVLKILEDEDYSVFKNLGFVAAPGDDR